MKFKYSLYLSSGNIEHEVPYNTTPWRNEINADTTSDRTQDLSDTQGFYISGITKYKERMLQILKIMVLYGFLIVVHMMSVVGKSTC